MERPPGALRLGVALALSTALVCVLAEPAANHLSRIVPGKHGKLRSASMHDASDGGEVVTEKDILGDGRQQDVTTTMPPQTGCSSCMMREGLRNLSLEAIKEQILSKLGLAQAPNMTGRQFPRIPRIHQMLEAYRLGGGNPLPTSIHGMQGDEPAPSTSSGAFKPGPVILDEEDDFHARTERVIAFAQPHPKIRHSRRSDIQYFKFSEKIIRNKVENAQLWVYVRGTDWPSGADGTTTPLGAEDGTSPIHPMNVTVFRVIKPPEGAESPLVTPILTEKRSRPRGRGGWITLEVTKLLVEWFRTRPESMGLTVHATDDQNKQLVVTDPNEEDGLLVPYVEVYTTDGRKHRTKRTIGLNCDETSDETRCCRYPLTVDFEEFGWDWIIAPKKYEANYCSGECPYVFLQKYPHTHIVHLAHPTGTVGPCCAPRKMSAISMLYFDNEFNIIYGLLPGMVVDRCGCS
ncbi:growth/differentiation factor 8 [Anabrus simplex]|uniref:growth/differentiation factor 8 n=1 Tax=Anabrus simplex TaxID=316456 RepID=UPI0035A29A62